MKDKLIHLSNGAWVRPSAVTAIRPLPAQGDYPDRVVVHHDGFHEVLPARDYAHAQEVADGLAKYILETP